MLTPIFHPNIDESAICVGDHWVAGERLIDLVVRIGQMIAYQEYNIKSPLNGEAVGFTAEQVGRAFSVPPSTMATRLVRVKKRVAEPPGIPFRIPDRADLPARMTWYRRGGLRRLCHRLGDRTARPASCLRRRCASPRC